MRELRRWGVREFGSSGDGEFVSSGDGRPVSLSLLKFDISLLESFTPSRDLRGTSLQTVGRQRLR